MLLKGGNKHNLSLQINLILLITYLVNELIIFPITTANVFPFLDRKPYYLVAIKCCYALLTIVGILGINKKPNTSWFLINLAAIGALTIWYCNFFFFNSHVGAFLLELSSIWLLVLTNLKSFINSYAIKRTVLRKIMIFVIPIIVFLLFLLKMWNYIL